MLGIAFGAEPAVTLPHIIETPLRGSTRRAKTSWVCVTSVPRAATTSCVRCGREVCPPVPARVTPIWLTAEVTGPDLEGDPAGVGPRVAVQRVHLGDVGEHAAVDGVQGAARARLLGGLEDQPDAAGQQALLAQPGEHDPDAEQDRRVHVVAAGVGHARHLRGEVDRAAVRDRQGVEVGAQADQALALLVEAVRDDVAPRAGADRQDLGHQADGLEDLDHPRGGAVLGVADLGVGVQVAADGDEPLVHGVDLGDDPGTADMVVDGSRHRRASLARAAGGRTVGGRFRNQTGTPRAAPEAEHEVRLS